jgi:hypothetical protein
VAKDVLRIVVDPFGKLPPNVRPEIQARAQELASALGLAEVELKLV